MLDDDFNDFLDSDDDAFFVEASNYFPDCDVSSSEVLLTSKKHIPKHRDIDISTGYVDNKKNESSLLENLSENDPCRNIPDTNNILKRGINYVTFTSVLTDSSNVISSGNKSNFKQDTIFSASSSSNASGVIKSKYIPDPISSNNVSHQSDYNFAPNATFIRCKSPNMTTNVNKDTFTPDITSARSSSSNATFIVDSLTQDSTSLKSDSCNVTPNIKKSTFNTYLSSYINNRFTPGFTPKAKKRKFAGPAGLLELFDESNEKKSDVCELKKMPSTTDNEFEHIASSQFAPELLLLASWQKLQTDVSSHASLHSSAKFYSIQRVLHESSKKKLPKHMVVPVLCVLLKEIKHKGSSIIPVFMDDTGEINGKIDAEVISKFKKYITEGAALILKKVTFLCNVLILKTDNLVSMYLPDGTENRLQSLESVLDPAEALKPMNCECLKQSHQNKNSLICTAPLRNGLPGCHKTGCFGDSLKIMNKPLNEDSINRKISTLKSSSISKFSSVKNMRNDAFLEDFLPEDNCMDEFDELLGNLDEESFLGDL